MTDELLLDTHVWLWWELGNYPFINDARLQIGRALINRRLQVAAISLHEVAYASLRGRIDLVVSLEDWFFQTLSDLKPTVVPITPSIAVASASLPADFHGDPADRLIAATAIVHRLTLCTHDARLIKFGRMGLYKLLEI